MTYFKLDIQKTSDLIGEYKSNKKKCLDNLGFVYRTLGYTQSAWNDINSSVFLEKVKKDRQVIDEEFEYLDNIYKEITRFKDDIDSICHKYGYKYNSVKIKFDDSELSTCKKYLNNAINYLNSALSSVEVYYFITNYKLLSLIKTLRTEIKNLINSINSILTSIDGLKNSINNSIYNSKYRISRIVKPKFNLKTIDYKWKITNIDVNKKNINEVNNYKSIYNNSINFKTTSNNINKVNSSIVVPDQIVLDNNKKEFDLQNNIMYSVPSIQDIDIKQNDDYTLNNGLNSEYASVKNINKESIDIKQKMNENINTEYANIKNIELRDIDDNYNLYNNVNSKVAYFNNIDKKEINNIRLNDYSNSYVLNENSIKTDNNNFDKVNYNINQQVAKSDDIVFEPTNSEINKINSYNTNNANINLINK